MTAYGIFQDQSEWRCHVAFGTGMAFIFKTEAVKNMDLSRYPLRGAGSNGGRYGRTAGGYCVPVEDIPGLAEIPLPTIWQEKLIKHARWFDRASEKDRGQAALKAAMDLFTMGLAPISGEVSEVTDKAAQLAGHDLLVGGHTVQVKSDWSAGGFWPIGTGNLYIQVEESNPSRQH